MAQNPKKFLSEVDFNAAIKLTGSAGTSGQVLTSGGVGVPTWTTAATANGASTIVLRDASGGFSAGVITGTSFNSLTGLSSTTPAAPGTAAVGTATTAARADHVHAIPTTVATTVSSTATADLITATMADNDYFRLRVGGTATDSGFVELATSDNGNEPIYIRQYSGVSFGTLVRTATILDGSGNTTFPGTVSGTTFSGSGASLTNVPGANVTGTLTSTVLGNSTHYIGTTAVALNRPSASQDLTGITTINSTTIPTSKTLLVTTDLKSTVQPVPFFYAAASSITLGTTTLGSAAMAYSTFAKSATLLIDTPYAIEAVLYVQTTIGSGNASNLTLSWGTGGQSGGGFTSEFQLMVNSALASQATSTTTTTSIALANIASYVVTAAPSGTQVAKIVVKGVIRTGNATSGTYTIYPVWSMTNSPTTGPTTSITTLQGSYISFMPLNLNTYLGGEYSLGVWQGV